MAQNIAWRGGIFCHMSIDEKVKQMNKIFSQPIVMC
jgi:hypothetical protein